MAGTTRTTITRTLAAVAAFTCAVPAASAVDQSRYLPRPLQAGTQDAVHIPIPVHDCFFRLREDPPFAAMDVAPADEDWLHSSIHLTLDIVPVQDVACPFHPPGQEPIVAVRLGTLPPGLHRVTYELRSFLEGEDAPYATTQGEHHALVLNHPRFESGFWYEPAKPGHGMSLIVRSGPAKEQYDASGASTGTAMPQSLYLSWQTYDREGRPLWLSGTAPDAALQPLRIELFQHEGMQFPALDPDDLRSTRWGEATVIAEACGRLRVVWRPDDPAWPARVVVFHRLVGTEELSYCEPHPTWGTVPARRVGD